MSYALNSANREVVITPSSKFALAAVGDFRGGELLVLFSVNGEFQDYPDQGSQIFNEPSGRVFETNGEPVKLKWTGDLGSTTVSTENIGGGGGSMTAEEIIAAIDGELGTGWRDALTYETVVALLDGELGTDWREGAPTIILASSDPLPIALRNTYDQFLTINGLMFDGGAHGTGEVTLQRAPDFNDNAAWTSDGLPVEHATDSATPQSSLYYSADALTLVTHYVTGGEYVTYWAGATYAPSEYNMAMWTATAASTGTLGLYDMPSGTFTFAQVYLASSHRGQLARHGDAVPYRWFIATGFEGILAWQEIAATDPSGLIPTSRGGTGGSTPAAALVNLGASAKTKTVVTEADSFTLSAATHGDNWTRLTKASGTTTITLPTMSAGETFELMRVGAGTIAFSGGTVENGAAISNVPVGGWLKLVSRGGTNYDLVAFGSSSGSAGSRTDVYLANDTWTKPASAKTVDVLIIGSGGGGGSGRRGATGDCSGGGAGGNGNLTSITNVPASEFAGTVSVVVGAIATGGLARTGSDQNGANGTAGNLSSFAPFKANGGAAGGGGTTTTGAGGTQVTSGIQLISAMQTANNPAAGGGTVSAGVAGSSSVYRAQSGGGGGITAGGVASAGGAGGLVFSAVYMLTAGSVAGGAGGVVGSTAPVSGTAFGNFLISGSGGGAAALTGYAQAGANGSFYGGGGGGGGAGRDTSGAGGAGGAGVVVVTTYF